MDETLRVLVEFLIIAFFVQCPMFKDNERSILTWHNVTTKILPIS